MIEARVLMISHFEIFFMFPIIFPHSCISIPGPVTEFRSEEFEHMLTVNCRYPTLLTHALLPQMIRDSSSTNRSCIIDVASQTSMLHVPYCTGYGATKAYNLAWSHGLREEVRGQNIEVFALTPGMTQSSMTKIDKPSAMVASAVACATAAVNAVGSGYYHCGYWAHHLSYLIVSSLPDSVRGPILLKSMIDLRQLADAKKKKEGAKSN